MPPKVIFKLAAPLDLRTLTLPRLPREQYGRQTTLQISGGQIKILKGAPIIEEVSSWIETPPPHAPTQIQYKRTFAQKIGKLAIQQTIQRHCDTDSKRFQSPGG